MTPVDPRQPERTTTVRVRFFGPAAQWAESAERRFDLPAGTTLGGLAGRIAVDYPRLGNLVGVRLAVNRTYVALNHPLQDGDEVAVIPPVSGG